MKRKIVVLLLFCCVCVLSGCSFESKEGGSNLKLISEKKVQSISKTNKIIVENSRTKKVEKTITDVNEVKKMLDIISRGKEENNVVTSEASNWYFFMYDKEEQLISTIWVWESGHFGFENDKEYAFNVSDIENLKAIIEK